MHLLLGDQLNFRQNDKRIKQKVSNQNILLVTKAILGQKGQSASVVSQSQVQKKKSVATSSTSKSKGKQGRLLLRDYLYLTNKNSQRYPQISSSRDKNDIRKDKNEIRKARYRLDEQKIFYLMQDEMKLQLNEVIQRLQRMKQSFKQQSLKNEDKNDSQNIAIIYSIKSIIKDKFRKGIEQINMMLFEQQQRKCQLLNPVIQSDGMKSDNCFNNGVRNMRKKQHKISLQLQKDNNIIINRQNNIAINGSKFMSDFV